jgi:hypothetical protein
LVLFPRTREEATQGKGPVMWFVVLILLAIFLPPLAAFFVVPFGMHF